MVKRIIDARDLDILYQIYRNPKINIFQISYNLCVEYANIHKRIKHLIEYDLLKQKLVKNINNNGKGTMSKLSLTSNGKKILKIWVIK